LAPHSAAWRTARFCQPTSKCRWPGSG
jgi:hypothetical protein